MQPSFSSEDLMLFVCIEIFKRRVNFILQFHGLQLLRN